MDYLIEDEEEIKRRNDQLRRMGFYYVCSREPKTMAKRQNIKVILRTLIDYEGLSNKTIYG
jgi:hypothetical protein